MKIAFSTLGCPGWSWSETVVSAKDLGYDGIELRGLEQQMYLPKATLLTGNHLQATKEHLKKSNLQLSCLASACYLHDSDFEAKLQEGEDYIDLAAKLGVPFVRVLGDAGPDPGINPYPRPQVKEGLQILGKSARSKGVTVLIETNGHLADSRLLADLLEDVNEPGVGILWDIHHPYRFFNEQPETTAARLGKAIKYIHMKDSKSEKGKIKYCILGAGDLPVRKILEVLLNQNYNSWLSLEWVKKWNPDLEEPGIVFPHFITAIQRYLKEITG